MRILVANMPGVTITDDGQISHYAKAGSRWPMTIGTTKSVDYYAFPFWLATTTALLKRETPHTVLGLDAVVHDLTPTQFLEQACAFRPHAVIVELTTISLPQDLELLRQLHQQHGCAIALAGHYPTSAHQRLLEENPHIQACLRGEYEWIALDWVRALETDSAAMAHIPGLSWRTDTSVHVNANRPLSRTDLLGLPWPDRTDFPATQYMDFCLKAPCVSITASRGCPAGCIYCQERHILYASPMVRTRDPDDIAQEMIYCRDHLGARQIYFDDMSLVINNKFVKELCAAMHRHQVGLPWTCMGDLMFVREETLQAMADAGCIGMKFGVESANPEMLKQIGKPLDLDRVHRLVARCKALGIRTHATYMIGLPGETEATAQTTFEFMLSLNTFTSQIARAVPFPGTPLYEQAVQHGWLTTQDLSQLDGMGQSVLSYPQLTAERIDAWYARFAKRIARQKLLNFCLNPRSSWSILGEVLKRRGTRGVASSVLTVIRRGL